MIVMSLVYPLIAFIFKRLCMNAKSARLHSIVFPYSCICLMFLVMAFVKPVYPVAVFGFVYPVVVMLAVYFYLRLTLERYDPRIHYKALSLNFRRYGWCWIVVIVVANVGLYCSGMYLLDGFAPDWANNNFGDVVLAALCIDYLGYKLERMRRRSLAKLDDVKSNQKFILYLRSFEFSKMYEMDALKLDKSFENLLVQNVPQGIPLVSLCDPDCYFPGLGGIKVQAKDEFWKQAVEILVKNARAVVMCFGFTEGLSWEIAYSHENVDPEKFFLVVPPRSMWKSFQKKAKVKNGELTFVEMLKKHGIELDLESRKYGCVYVFDRNWHGHCVLKSGSPKQIIRCVVENSVQCETARISYAQLSEELSPYTYHPSDVLRLNKFKMACHCAVAALIAVTLTVLGYFLNINISMNAYPSISVKEYLMNYVDAESEFESAKEQFVAQIPQTYREGYGLDLDESEEQELKDMAAEAFGAVAEAFRQEVRKASETMPFLDKKTAYEEKENQLIFAAYESETAEKEYQKLLEVLSIRAVLNGVRPELYRRFRLFYVERHPEFSRLLPDYERYDSIEEIRKREAWQFRSGWIVGGWQQIVSNVGSETGWMLSRKPTWFAAAVKQFPVTVFLQVIEEYVKEKNIAFDELSFGDQLSEEDASEIINRVMASVDMEKWGKESDKILNAD